MISVNELKPKVYFIFEEQPYVVLETHHLKMQQRRPVVQTRMRNLLNGRVLERNFAQSDVFEEADIQKKKVEFLYKHRDEFWFSGENNPAERFKVSQDILGQSSNFLKNNTVVEAMYFGEDIIGVQLPIKMDFLVTEAPPGIKGDTATGGNKQVKIETGAYINVPLFINEGDVIRINTDSGEYAERTK